MRLNTHPALKRRLRWFVDRLPFPKGERLVLLRFGPLKGVRMLLDLSTSDRHLWLNMYEPWVQRTLIDVLRPGMNVWDVGAFIGYYVALASRLTDGSVIAIEPDPNNVRRLYGTIAANGLNRIEIVPIAVGNEVGEAAFAGEGMTGLLHKDGLSNVGITTLDGLVEKFGRPDVIIMDIEGGEADALVADSRLLRENPPSFVLVELHGDAGVTAARNLVGLGYSMSTQAGTPIDVQMRKAHRVHALATMGRRDGREMPRSEVEEGL